VGTLACDNVRQRLSDELPKGYSVEIRDPLHGSIEVSDAEAAVLDSRAFQRLRQIKQLGFAEFSFPGATHNRYLHSLGAAHLATQAFDHTFRKHKFSNDGVRLRLRQCVRLAALLHDVGHGPLSHTTEEVMPNLAEVNVKAYASRRTDITLPTELISKTRQANHEDFTIKFVTDSPLTEVLRTSFADFSALHIACLIDKTLKSPDDFFTDSGIDFRPILSQIVSSELDVDRMDYLERDAYFCGTNYGRVEIEWLIDNLTFHVVDGQAYLALNKRALYAFDDFLLARHHMNLMVYFHHKSIIYEEMLHRYLTSKDCSFFLPPNINEYVKCTDYSLYEHLASANNEWAKRITERRIYTVFFEYHVTEVNDRVREIQERLENSGIPTIVAKSSVRLSKYHGASTIERNFPIYVVDRFDSQSKPYPIEKSTEIFQKYDEIRRIERVYVPPEFLGKAEKFR
jgi:uncharacterized protein